MNTDPVIATTAETAKAREDELYRKIGRLEMELDWRKKKLASSSVEERRRMIESDHRALSVTRQCELLGLPRASYYHRPQPKPAENLRLMRFIDETYLAFPFFGSRQMTRYLRRQGERINRKRVQRLMSLMRNDTTASAAPSILVAASAAPGRSARSSLSGANELAIVAV